jgi:4-amino-4-deoxy-L-arabinose transferase-like glycosyltransferase
MFILSLIPFILTFLFTCVLLNQFIKSTRESFLYAAIIMGILLFLSTELLSVFHSISYSSMLGFWCITTFILGFKFKDKLLTYYKSGQLQSQLIQSKNDFLSLDLKLKILSGVILLIVVVEGFIAVTAFPNNHDAMTYHLPRVMHWIQNSSLEHYPTNILRQLYSNPFSEYIILHLIILAKADRLSNLVQYFSMIGSLAGITLIAKYFHASRSTQIYTALIAVTIPMGVIQASNTQNDYVVTFWIICFIYTILKILKTPLNKINKFTGYSLLAGISLGLSILTKGTAGVFVLPFCFVFFIYWFYKYKLEKVYLLAFIIAIPLLINAPHFYRNYITFEDILMPQEHKESLYRVQSITPGGFTSVLLRNLGLHLPLPDGKLKTALEEKFKDFHTVINHPINSPDTTIGGLYGYPSFGFFKLLLNDHYAANPFHLLLIFISLLFFMNRKFRENNQKLGIYALLLVCSFILFCLLIKWQPFASRLHLPLFVLFSPVCSITLTEIDKTKYSLISYIFLVLLIVYSLPFLFMSQFRPLLGEKSYLFKNKYEQYFANRPTHGNAYLRILNFTYQMRYYNIGIEAWKDGYAILGLDVWKDDYEYPIWVFFRETGEPFRLQHASVTNNSLIYQKSFPQPETIIRLNREKGQIE